MKKPYFPVPSVPNVPTGNELKINYLYEGIRFESGHPDKGLKIAN